MNARIEKLIARARALPRGGEGFEEIVRDAFTLAVPMKRQVHAAILEATTIPKDVLQKQEVKLLYQLFTIDNGSAA